MLSAQRPILRNFIELHDISIPWTEGDSLLVNEEKIITYIEKRLFLEAHEDMRFLSSIEDHFEYAVHNVRPRKNQKKDNKDQEKSLNNSRATLN